MTTERVARSIITFAVTLILAGCGGGGGGSSSALRIQVSPTNPLIAVDGHQSFAAQVTGSADLRVSWSVQEVGGGTTVSTGTGTATYTAPSQPGTYHVIATSQADPTKTSSAEVRVYSLPPAPP